MKTSFRMPACYSLFLFRFCLLVFSCTKTTVAPTRQVSSSTKHLDRHINAALKRESIQPSKMSEDAEFLRRVHLDLTGKIPTPEEVLDFLKDGSSNKRQKKIDLLLDSDAYLDYWSGLWVNWLIGRREDGDDRRIGLTFWVRDALTKNMPYNQFVQELIAADGELRDNGAGNYIMRYELRGLPDFTYLCVFSWDSLCSVQNAMIIKQKCGAKKISTVSPLFLLVLIVSGRGTSR